MRELSNKVLLIASVLIVLHIRSFSSEETQDDAVARKNFKQQCRQDFGGISRKNVCCAASCGRCGGRGCSKRPGGRRNCCGSRIKQTCGDNGKRAPCIIREVTNPSTNNPNVTEPPIQTTTVSTRTCIDSKFNFEKYFGWKSHMDYLDCLTAKYSEICEIIDIGNSVEGRSIKVIKISQPSSDGAIKPAIWIDGGIHAREWISPSSVEYFVYQLVEKSDLQENKRMIDNFDIYVAPILNPDGYEYTRTNDRYWRKNRGRNPGSSCIGVDLNRNWGYKWGGKGASTNPCSDTYRGSKAFSEPETKAVRDFILRQNQKQDFKMYLTYHSYGQYVLYGWGYDRIDPPNATKLKQLANVGANAMKKENGGSRYSVGGAAKLLYPASGGSDDWALGSGGFQYSYTIELPPKGGSGFVLPPSRILPVGKEMHAGVAAMVSKLIKDSK